MIDATAVNGEILDKNGILAMLDCLGGDFPLADIKRRVVGVRGPNSAETLLRIFAVIRKGGIPAPFAPDTEDKVVRNCLDRIGACLLWDLESGWEELDGLTTHKSGFDLIMHSSGSTGYPKPLAIRLAAMHRNSLDVARFLGLSQSDIHLGTFSHCYMSGLYNATILPLVTGATTIAAPQLNPASLANFVEIVQRYRPSVLWLSPLAVRILTSLRGIHEDLFKSLRFAISCTAPLPAGIQSAFEEKFRCPIIESYGLCETLITTIERPGASVPGSVGKAIGPKNAVTCDEDGQVLVANGAHFTGYLDGGPPKVGMVPVEPYETGDIGHFDNLGNLFITGRLSEVINLDGIKISPEKIEAVLNLFPGVAGSAVVPKVDQTGRTTMTALVACSNELLSPLAAHVAANLPSPQQPNSYKAVAALPLTANGKLDRIKLKREFQK